MDPVHRARPSPPWTPVTPGPPGSCPTTTTPATGPATTGPAPCSGEDARHHGTTQRGPGPGRGRAAPDPAGHPVPLPGRGARAARRGHPARPAGRPGRTGRMPVPGAVGRGAATTAGPPSAGPRCGCRSRPSPGSRNHRALQDDPSSILHLYRRLHRPPARRAGRCRSASSTSSIWPRACSATSGPSGDESCGGGHQPHRRGRWSWPGRTLRVLAGRTVVVASRRRPTRVGPSPGRWADGGVVLAGRWPAGPAPSSAA